MYCYKCETTVSTPRIDFQQYNILLYSSRYVYIYLRYEYRRIYNNFQSYFDSILQVMYNLYIFIYLL